MLRNRIIYVAVLILTVIFAYFCPGMVSSLFFYTVLFIPVASLLHTVYVYLRFSYLQEIDKKFITKGEKVCFHVDIVNESKVLYPYVEILFYGVDTIFNKHFKTKKIAILPHSAGRYDFELECQYRGYYEVGLKRIRIKDFLGLFSLSYKVSEPRYVTVYPRIVALDSFPISTNKLSYVEGMLSHKEEDQLTVSDTRQYAYGDSIKRIHWKLSAKKGEILVKNYDGAVTVGATILLDLEKNPYEVMQNTILEDKVIEVTVAVIYYCLQHHIKVDFKYHQEELDTKEASDFSHFEELYRILFKIKFDSEIAFSNMTRLALEGNFKTNTIVFITSNLSEKLYSQISRHKEHGFNMILIYISPEDIAPKNAAKKQEISTILSALQEINVKAYEIQINDDIKYVLESYGLWE